MFRLTSDGFSTTQFPAGADGEDVGEGGGHPPGRPQRAETREGAGSCALPNGILGLSFGRAVVQIRRGAGDPLLTCCEGAYQGRQGQKQGVVPGGDDEHQAEGLLADEGGVQLRDLCGADMVVNSKSLRPQPLNSSPLPRGCPVSAPLRRAPVHPTPGRLTRFLDTFSSFIQARRFLRAKSISLWVVLISDNSDSEGGCREGAGSAWGGRGLL